MEALIESIKRHEGYSDRVYLDTSSFLTCGWGHCLRVGSLVPIEASEAFFKADIASAVNAFAKLAQEYKTLLLLNPARRRVIVELIFNIGLVGVRGFIKMLTAIEQGDFNEAADQLTNSVYATQVGERAKELAEIMRKGQ